MMRDHITATMEFNIDIQYLKEGVKDVDILMYCKIDDDKDTPWSQVTFSHIGWSKTRATVVATIVDQLATRYCVAIQDITNATVPHMLITFSTAKCADTKQKLPAVALNTSSEDWYISHLCEKYKERPPDLSPTNSLSTEPPSDPPSPTNTKDAIPDSERAPLLNKACQLKLVDKNSTKLPKITNIQSVKYYTGGPFHIAVSTVTSKGVLRVLVDTKLMAGQLLIVCDSSKDQHYRDLARYNIEEDNSLDQFDIHSKIRELVQLKSPHTCKVQKLSRRSCCERLAEKVKYYIDATNKKKKC
jgi:hypothetical protein